MLTPNLLPAILVAGPPHSGKSVLAYLLSQRLRAAHVPHILLRAAPDGEGDWFYQSNDEVRVRQRQKGSFNNDLIESLLQGIRDRSLPMLVDIGGRPRDSQFRLFDACTHVIHLWREADDRQAWTQWLDERSLIPIASLRSYLTLPDSLEPGSGALYGIISGLERQHPQPGATFAEVFARVQGICAYPPAFLKSEHISRAPLNVPLLTLEQLAHDLGIVRAGEKIWWNPEDLPRLRELIPPGEPLALFGPGPVWLYAALAAHVAPAPFHLFDARYFGWMLPPPVVYPSPQANAEFTLTADLTADPIRLVFTRQDAHYLLKPLPVHVPPLPPERAVVLDGPMPNWLWAALAQALRQHPSLAAFDPRQSAAIPFWTANA